ncbi:sugar ABC transporter substrate-binding protein [Devosia sp. YIM 151766]|uniref:sugar ABC transporter substrate-binding protein n=1 Tax=Devosia sp. YIM 151766 TaxID=3017325 RepID=UPI00255CCADB|nr:sugar ABC transporter substrate-binding protein [Devosia sp. YIM 151766]WIY52978.1 sugar ABC transporter substrate-binding protein [Devosia sp. YIM 151766]
MKRRTLLKGLAAGGLVTALPMPYIGAQHNAISPRTGKPFQIAFSHPVSEAPIVSRIRNFATERGAELGVEVLHDSTTSSQLDRQVSTLETWIEANVDAICVSPISPSSIAGLQKAAQEKGIIWTTYAMPMEGSDGTLGWDNDESGRLVGEHCAKWLSEQDIDGEVLLLTLKAIQSGQGRTDEPQRILSALDGTRIVSAQDASDAAKGLQVTENVLQANPGLNVVIGFSDDGALGALRAFTGTDKDPAQCYIAGQDGSLEALQRIREGGFYKASSALPVKSIGHGVVDLNYELLTGTAKSDVFNVGVVLASMDDPAQLDDLISQWD